MAGQGHQFPGNFQSNAGGMRSGFVGSPMSASMQSMPNQLAGNITLICISFIYSSLEASSHRKTSKCT